MSFKHSCFISYRRVDVELTRVFIQNLKKALENEVSQIAPSTTVFVDSSGMAGMALLDPSLAKSICQSVIMVMVYVPAYFDEEHRWCAREYEAMVKLEAERLAKLPPGAKARVNGLIAPIVFRGPEAIPAEIKERRLYTDFSRYSLAGNPNISKNRNFADKIRNIADRFLEIWTDLRRLPDDPCQTCDAFQLPTDADVLPIIHRLQGNAPLAPAKHEAPVNG